MLFFFFFRDGLWRWLDQKQRFGFTRIDAKSLESLMTLASLAPDLKLRKLAQMVLYLQLFELQNAYWQVWELRKLFLALNT